MPKKVDPKVKERCVQQMLDHVVECPSSTAASQVVAKRKGRSLTRFSGRRFQSVVATPSGRCCGGCWSGGVAEGGAG